MFQLNDALFATNAPAMQEVFGSATECDEIKMIAAAGSELTEGNRRG